MPFKSQAQRRFFYAAESRGELPRGTAARWQKETGKKKLPEKLEKAAYANLLMVHHASQQKFDPKNSPAARLWRRMRGKKKLPEKVASERRPFVGLSGRPFTSLSGRPFTGLLRRRKKSMNKNASFETGMVVAMEKVAASRLRNLVTFGKKAIQASSKSAKKVKKSVEDVGVKETARQMARGAKDTVRYERKNIGRRVGSRIAGEPLMPTSQAARMMKQRQKMRAAFRGRP